MIPATVRLYPENRPVAVRPGAATEVAPQTWMVQDGLPPLPPPVALAEWECVDPERNLWQPTLIIRPAYLPLSEWNPKRYGCGRRALTCLIVAGFVDYSNPTPGSLAVNLASYYAHVDAARTEAMFWNEERLQKYAAARSLVSSGRYSLITHMPDVEKRIAAAEAIIRAGKLPALADPVIKPLLSTATADLPTGGRQRGASRKSATIPHPELFPRS